MSYYKLCLCPLYCIYNILFCCTTYYPAYFFIEELSEIAIEKDFISPYEFSLDNKEQNWLTLEPNEIVILNRKLTDKIAENCTELSIECEYYYTLDYGFKEFIGFQILWHLKNVLIFSYLEEEYKFIDTIMLKEKIKTSFMVEWYKPLLKKNTCSHFLEHFLKKEDGTIIDKNTTDIEEQKYLKKKYIDLVYKIIDKKYDYYKIIFDSLNSLQGYAIIDEIMQNNY